MTIAVSDQKSSHLLLFIIINIININMTVIIQNEIWRMQIEVNRNQAEFNWQYPMVHKYQAEANKYLKASPSELREFTMEKRTGKTPTYGQVPLHRRDRLNIDTKVMCVFLHDRSLFGSSN